MTWLGSVDRSNPCDQIPQPSPARLVPGPAQRYLQGLAGLDAAAQQQESRSQLGPELHPERLAVRRLAEMQDRFFRTPRLAQPEGQLPSLFPASWMAFYISFEGLQCPAREPQRLGLIARRADPARRARSLDAYVSFHVSLEVLAQEGAGFLHPLADVDLREGQEVGDLRIRHFSQEVQLCDLAQTRRQTLDAVLRHGEQLPCQQNRVMARPGGF